MQETTPPKKIGLWTSTSLVVGNMIGAGVFLMPSALAAYGGISIIGWLFSAAGALLLARVFSKLSKMVPNKSGGPYTYSKAGLGEFAAFIVAWGYWISIWVSNAAIAIAFVSALSVFFPILEENILVAVATGLMAIWGLTWINSKGVLVSGKMQLLTTILKLIPLIAVIIGGFFFFDLNNFKPFNISDESAFAAIAITASMTLYAFMGVESATIPANEIEQAEKTVPRATMLGTIITTLVYILSTLVIMGMLPLNALTSSPAPFADAMKIISGPLGEKAVAAGAAIAAFGGLNGWILVQGQIAMVTAQDQLFPPIFKKENKRGVPIVAIIIGSVLSSILMIMNYTDALVEQFKFMILLTALCVLIPYLFSAAALVLLQLKGRQTKSKFIYAIIPGSLAFLYSLWAIYGAGETAVFWGFLLLLAGIPLFVWMKRN